MKIQNAKGLKIVIVSLISLTILFNYNCQKGLRVDETNENAKDELVKKLNLFNEEFRLAHPEYFQYDPNDNFSKKKRKAFGKY